MTADSRTLALPLAFSAAQANLEPQLSIVVPAFDEACGLPELHRRLCLVMDGIGRPWELVLVNDGSRDASAEVIARLCAGDRRVRGIGLSRNYGFQVATTAGLDAARGQAVILMDADLQDPPEVIPEMVQQWLAGFDVVYGVRSERDGETWLKRATAGAFYRLIRRITRVDIPLDTGDFRLMDAKVVDAIRQMPEQNRFLRGMVSWVGFKQTGVAYHRQARQSGKTKFTVGKMVRFALDAITAFSYVPLQLAGVAGGAFTLLGTLSLAACGLLRLLRGSAPGLGTAATIAAVLFAGGVQLMCLGIAGEYLGRIYDEVKRRPLYLVDQRWGDGGSRGALNSAS